jgi:hypothetical protein
LSDEQFWPNAQYLINYFISLRILAFIALYIKTNTFFNRSKPKKITEDLINSIKFNESVNKNHNAMKKEQLLLYVIKRIITSILKMV